MVQMVALSDMGCGVRFISGFYSEPTRADVANLRKMCAGFDTEGRDWSVAGQGYSGGMGDGALCQHKPILQCILSTYQIRTGWPKVLKDLGFHLALRSQNYSNALYLFVRPSAEPIKDCNIGVPKGFPFEIPDISPSAPLTAGTPKPAKPTPPAPWAK